VTCVCCVYVRNEKRSNSIFQQNCNDPFIRQKTNNKMTVKTRFYLYTREMSGSRYRGALKHMGQV